MAAYKAYRLGISAINLKKSHAEKSCLIKELTVINMIDALVAVLSMQNAIMNAKGFELKNGFNELSSYTSAVIFAAIVFITIRSMLSNRE